MPSADEHGRALGLPDGLQPLKLLLGQQSRVDFPDTYGSGNGLGRFLGVAGEHHGLDAAVPQDRTAFSAPVLMVSAMSR